MIPTVVGMLRGTNAWFHGSFGQVSCKLLASSQGLSIACSVFSLTVLAFERFFVVVFPLWNIITIKGTLRSIIVIWVAAFALSSPLLYAAKVRLHDGVASCIEDWPPSFNPKRARAIYTIVAFVFLYALPLLIIAVLYSVIGCRVIFSNLELAHTRKHDLGKPSSVTGVQEKRAEDVCCRGPCLCILLVPDAPEYVFERF